MKWLPRMKSLHALITTPDLTIAGTLSATTDT